MRSYTAFSRPDEAQLPGGGVLVAHVRVVARTAVVAVGIVRIRVDGLPASMDGASLRLWSAPEFQLAVAAGEALVPELGASVAVCTAWCVPGAD